MDSCSLPSSASRGVSHGVVALNRRRTNVQQQTCNIDLPSSFYYLFFSFVLLELKPFVFKWKVLGEKFWKGAKSVKKCENYERILPFRCCPLVFFPESLKVRQGTFGALKKCQEQLEKWSKLSTPRGRHLKNAMVLDFFNFAPSPEKFCGFFFRTCLGILHWKTAGIFGELFLVSVSHEMKHKNSSKNSGRNSEQSLGQNSGQIFQYGAKYYTRPPNPENTLPGWGAYKRGGDKNSCSGGLQNIRTGQIMAPICGQSWIR